MTTGSGYLSSTKTTDRDRGLRSLVRELKKGQNATLTVGVHQDAGNTSAGVPLGSIGFWMDKGFIHSSGKKVRARPWVRATTDKFSKRYINILKQGYFSVLLGRMTVEGVLEDLGKQAKDDMKSFIINDEVKPKTSKRVMARKSVKKTLFETGALFDAVDFKVNV